MKPMCSLSTDLLIGISIYKLKAAISYFTVLISSSVDGASFNSWAYTPTVSTYVYNIILILRYSSFFLWYNLFCNNNNRIIRYISVIYIPTCYTAVIDLELRIFLETCTTFLSPKWRFFSLLPDKQLYRFFLLVLGDIFTWG